MSKVSPQKVIIFLLLTSISLFADLYSDIAFIAKEMSGKSINGINEMSMSSLNKPIVINTIEKDGNFGLPFGYMYKIIIKELNQYTKQVQFRPFDGIKSSIAREMAYSGTKSSSDSIVMSGNWIIEEGDDETVWYTISLHTMSGRLLYASDTYELDSEDAPKNIEIAIFKKLEDEEKFEKIIFNGSTIEKLEELFNTKSGKVLLTPPAQYKFINNNNYAEPSNVESIRQILSLKYGINFVKESKRVIKIEPSKTLSFTSNLGEKIIADIVNQSGMVPDTFPNATKEVGFRDTEASGKLAKYNVVEVDENPHFKKVLTKVNTIFNKEYPALFSPFNYEKLKNIFPKSDKLTILTGTRNGVNHSTGEEIVIYKWKTAHEWLAGLNKVVTRKKKRRTFKIKTKLMRVYQDPDNLYRFWAVVKQDWNTLNKRGKSVYRDEGFLFINFEFDEDVNMKSFKIDYRLWFYDYQYDHMIDGVVISSRGDKIKKAINEEFKKNVGGVNMELKQEMVNYVVSQVGLGSLNKSRTYHIK